MSRGLNRVMLIGNVGTVEVRTTRAEGTRLAKISLATNRTWKDAKGATQQQVQWHRITAWDKLADIVEQYVKKGDRLYIDGRLEYSQTEDGAGTKRYFTDIIANEIILLGNSRQDGESPQKTTQQATRQNPLEPDDDMPF